MSPHVSQSEIEHLLTEEPDQGVEETLRLLRESMELFIQTFEDIPGVAVNHGDGEALIRVNPDGNSMVIDRGYHCRVRTRGVRPEDEISACYSGLLNSIERVEDYRTMRQFDSLVRLVVSAKTAETGVPRTGATVVGDISFEPLPAEQRAESPTDVDPLEHLKEQVDEQQEHIEANREPLQIQTVEAADTHDPTVDFETAMYMRSQSDVPDNYGVAEVVDYEPDDTYDEVTVTMVLPDGSRGEITAIVGASREECALADGEYPLRDFCRKCYNRDVDGWVDLEHVDRLQGAVFLVAETEDGGYTSTETGNYRTTLRTVIDEPLDESDDKTDGFEPSEKIRAAVLAVVVVLVIIGIGVEIGLFLGL